jgi:hypothetical protein
MAGTVMTCLQIAKHAADHRSRALQSVFPSSLGSLSLVASVRYGYLPHRIRQIVVLSHFSSGICLLEVVSLTYLVGVAFRFGFASRHESRLKRSWQGWNGEPSR